MGSWAFLLPLRKSHSISYNYIRYIFTPLSKTEFLRFCTAEHKMF